MSTVKDTFDLAAGSVAGREHRASLRNGHDAFSMAATNGLLAAVVCDGCGSGEHSEVGAKLGARMVVCEILRYWNMDERCFREGQIDRGLTNVRRSLLGQMQNLGIAMGGSYSRNVSEYFLFTVMGIVVTHDHAFVFGCGDGVFAVNGKATVISAPGNAPEYLGYSLVENERKLAPIFTIHAVMPAKDLQTALVATDGLLAFMEASEKRVPGQEEAVGPISQFWEQDRYFSNPFSIQRRLNLVNRSVQHVDYEEKRLVEEHGHLADDTTLAVLRRKPCSTP